MKESAQAAVSFLRSRSSELGLSDDYFCEARPAHPRARRRDPEGRPVGRYRVGDVDRVDSNGPESGSDLAMTGEVTLTGQVLPIGGVKEKCSVRNARGSGDLRCRMRNEVDLDDVPEEVRDTMTFVPVEELSEVLYHALGKRVISRVPLGADHPARNNVVAMRGRPAAKGARTERKRNVAVRKR